MSLMERPGHTNKWLKRLQTYFSYLAEFVFFIALALVIIVSIKLIWFAALEILTAKSISGLIAVLNPVLYLVMLAELVHILLLSIKTHHITIKPMLALIWIALIRHTLVNISIEGSVYNWDVAVSIVWILILTIAIVHVPDQNSD